MRRSVLLSVCVLALSCGNKPAAAPEAASSDEQPGVEAGEAQPQPEPEPGQGPEPKPTEQAEGEAPGAAGGKKPERTIKYIMASGGGLEVEVEDVRFTPRATPIKVGNGWGVRIVVDVKVLDDNAHSLLDPKNGPLAFAGNVERGGKVTRIVDKREGEGEKLIAAGDKVALERVWPGKTGEKPLSAGQSLALEVGLWGLGPDADQRRAVRAFFQVKLKVGAGKPQPVISPPPSDAI
jgi:hypothetical protein